MFLYFSSSSLSSTLQRTQPFLSSYLSRIGRIENPSCSDCEHLSQDISHLILHCPATDSLRRSLFDDCLSLYDLWSRPWGVARLLGLHGLPPCPHPSEGSGNQQQQQQPGEARVEIDVSLDTFALVSNYHCFKVSASIFHFLLSAILLIYLLLIKFSAKWVNSYFTFSHSHLFDCCYFVVVLTCDQTWLYSFFLSCCKLHHFDQSFTAVNEW